MLSALRLRNFAEKTKFGGVRASGECGGVGGRREGEFPGGAGPAGVPAVNPSRLAESCPVVELASIPLGGIWRPNLKTEAGTPHSSHRPSPHVGKNASSGHPPIGVFRRVSMTEAIRGIRETGRTGRTMTSLGVRPAQINTIARREIGLTAGRRNREIASLSGEFFGKAAGLWQRIVHRNESCAINGVASSPAKPKETEFLNCELLVVSFRVC